MEEFNFTTFNCGLSSVDFDGSPFTWTNGSVWQRLDRALINSHWLEAYPTTRVSYLARGHSDHAPLLIRCRAQGPRGGGFRFLNVWRSHSQFREVVTDEWNAQGSGESIVGFHRKLMRVRNRLKAWSRDTFGNLKEGDANTAFFHATVRQRRNKNFIAQVKEESDTWLEATEEIKASVVAFYTKLFSSEGHEGPFSMPFAVPQVGEEDSQMMAGLPTLEEMRETVFGMNVESAPGPDGFGMGFYQSCWRRLRRICYAPYMTSSKAFPSLAIGLALCFFFYQKWMAGFVPGRGIVDNILLAQELVLVNGEPSGFFKSSRWVRQGDPLSPALFLLVAEFLGRGLHHLFLEHAGFFYVSAGSRIPFLAFVDDMIIFTRCSLETVTAIHDFLASYQAMSRQKVNEGKSSFICPSRATANQVALVSSVLQFKEGHLPVTYLGAPLVRGRLGCMVFDDLLLKLRQRLLHWSSKLLSEFYFPGGWNICLSQEWVPEVVVAEIVNIPFDASQKDKMVRSPRQHLLSPSQLVLLPFGSHSEAYTGLAPLADLVLGASKVFDPSHFAGDRDCDWFRLVREWRGSLQFQHIRLTLKDLKASLAFVFRERNSSADALASANLGSDMIFSESGSSRQRLGRAFI
ncbi:uncharacterized protein [Coffea arabica]|uniref:Reverse transcriptase domain-containing protein n=1 Tax=Coffea arabica TaxID=13443 RepID=A0ABM4VUC5_COFAR